MRPQVVVIGAGFGGLATAKELAGDDVDVTVIDRNNFHTFLPLLYQVATAGLNAADVAYPVRGIFRRQANVHFLLATATGVDWERAQLLVDDGAPVPFDHLVVAAGAAANTFGVPGAELALPLYVLDDAVQLRNHVLSRFELADGDQRLVDDGGLTFVVVGGGATGVEVAGALVELFDQVLRKDFRSLEVRNAKVILVEMGDELLAPFASSSRRHARQTLERRGVDVRTGTVVDRITPTSVHLAGGEVIPAHSVVWAAGVRASPIAGVLGVRTGSAGRIVVGHDLAIEGHPNAYAIGDVAAIPADGGLLPQLAQVAIQSGKHAARQVRASLAGRPSAPFRYHDRGMMATIGRRAAVAELPVGLKLRGTVAWVAWLGLHLVYLAGFRNRFSVFLNWAWNYVTWDRGPRLIFGQRAREPQHVGEQGDRPRGLRERSGGRPR